jgi:hypothetical protein
MSTRPHRPQKSDGTANEDTQPLDVKPLTNVDDRLHNPKDLDIDTAAIANGVEHGGMTQNRAESLAARGSGGRKRSGAFGRSRAGRDISKKR